MSQLWERTPIATSPLSVVVIFDQADAQALQRTLTELQPVLQQRGHGFEVLVPAPQSAEQLLQPTVQAMPSARLVLDDEVSQGVGSALKIGVAAAQHPLLFVLPVGYSASYLPAFLKEIDQVDLVCGARESKARGWKRRQFFSIAYQIYGIWMQDPDCALRLYRRELFQRMPLQSKGPFVQIEILAKANFQSKLMTEVPVTGPDDAPSKTKQDFWKVLNAPNFGSPPEKIVEKSTKSIIQTQAPEVRP